ncbi:branched-chain amino acid transport system ATP-binding protein [Haloplanus aerogenes]|uniref:Branched-chain amino acid transport system ATP-binding protein n=1 Tax=Haloplanus aerogenes TaxID=660522 RepID=A0A3M0DVI0_9EURY|nr:ABC transporter ATP-binding protein [Haloplanus aerogenes]RMB25117.1 branched-chain amino acid transport system ATP-binding protein [Haloplanus aerogenes]
MSDPILAMDGVHVSYGNTPILRDIDIDIDDGETVGIMGRNGVGKTTLMKTVIGLLTPDEGTIRYAGEDVTDLSADRRARLGMGYIPQGRDVFPDLTVEQNISMGLSISEHKSEKLVDDVYDYFPRLAERRGQKAGTMSGGEQQMLAIGRALAGNPDLLLLDEPSEGIQPSIVQQITDDIANINEEFGVTVLFVEQNLQVIRELSERCYVVDGGRIETELDAEDLEDVDAVADYLAV